MSNRQLEERRERLQTERVAKALGMSVEELDAQEWSIEPQVSEEGMIYSYAVTLESGQTEYIILHEE